MLMNSTPLPLAWPTTMMPTRSSPPVRPELEREWARSWVADRAPAAVVSDVGAAERDRGAGRAEDGDVIGLVLGRGQEDVVALVLRQRRHQDHGGGADEGPVVAVVLGRRVDGDDLVARDNIRKSRR
ncbi:hypothetical protein [Nannocystis sp. SCPEA4]|uniref:hypothetical protein n=1 Tax=Nannocystis sp. SCPEA4 TaxID=2996787 RepID=UPI002270D0CE|nr:hypothetical protein [Nannocystis sp. SCPEA4]MCY1060967.1 hypothetical protein [Nannocystis sp. SCPEA4]